MIEEALPDTKLRPTLEDVASVPEFGLPVVPLPEEELVRHGPTLRISHLELRLIYPYDGDVLRLMPRGGANPVPENVAGGIGVFIDQRWDLPLQELVASVVPGGR